MVRPGIWTHGSKAMPQRGVAEYMGQCFKLNSDDSNEQFICNYLVQVDIESTHNTVPNLKYPSNDVSTKIWAQIDPFIDEP